MESLIEVQRSCHEEIERCVDLMTKESLIEKRTVDFLFKSKIIHFHACISEKASTFWKIKK